MMIQITHDDTYHLIWSRTTYPNPACSPKESIDWYQAAKIRGEALQGWVFWLGGGWTTFAEMKVLDVVTLAPGESLDLTRTTLHQKLVADREERRQGSDLSGWLSPEGEWHPCAYHAHDLYAAYVLAEKTRGWLRIDKKGWSLGDPTEAQAAWLLEKREAW